MGVTAHADTLLTQGRIYTIEDDNPTAEAMAVRDGRVMAVGRESDVAALAGPATRVVRLAGRTVFPGLIDAHVHLLSLGLRLRRMDLAGVESLEEALAVVRVGVSRVAPGEWVQGGGWDQNLWRRLPDRHDLDAVAPANPVMLESKDLHTCWANTLALRLAGIAASTPDPEGGEIVRDAATGEPTGLLREGAVSLLREAIPAPSPERCDEVVSDALRLAASKGLTGLQVPEGPHTFSSLQRLRATGALPLRVYCFVQKEYLQDCIRLGVRTGFGDEWLRLGHVKLFLDGALGSQTAHMLEPYSGTDSRGIETMSRKDLRAVVAEAASAGIAPAIHAIGDAANRVALDVLEETASLWRPVGLRPRVEHVQLLHPADAGRLGPLGVVASMQPSHQPSDWMVAERYWGDRSHLAYAWRTVLDSGGVLAYGSDCPVEPIDPMLGLHAAVARQTVEGLPAGGWYPEQRLTPLEALRAFTLGAAFASGEESLKGSLAPGKLADFVVLSHDPITGPPELFLRTRVDATVVGGRVVYGEL
ncbi:MAG: amidohydrolase [Sphingomonadaceae bacterium]